MIKFLIIPILLFCANIEAQNPILALGQHVKSEQSQGTYMKDMDNVLNNFEGTWLLEDGNKSLELILFKEEMYYDGYIYQDVLAGAYDYKENGVSVMNTLSEIDHSTINGKSYKLSGNVLFSDCYFMPVADCVDGEVRVSIFLEDILENNAYYSLILHKRVINGQEALRVYINGESRKGNVTEGESIPPPTIDLRGEHVFFKQ